MRGLRNLFGKSSHATRETGPETKHLVEVMPAEPIDPKLNHRSYQAHVAGHSAPPTSSPIMGAPLWQRLGWKREGDTYTGFYRFKRDGKWPGLIKKRSTGLEVYIFMPPVALRNHKHWACFNHVGKNKFKVHFIQPITEVSQAIVNVQRLLAEAIIFHSNKED